MVMHTREQAILDRLVELADGDLALVNDAAAALEQNLGRRPKLEELVLRIVSEIRVRESHVGHAASLNSGAASNQPSYA